MIRDLTSDLGLGTEKADWKSLIPPFHYGSLKITTDHGEERLFSGEQSGPSAHIHVSRPWSLFSRLLRNGSIGFAEGFMQGVWHSSNLAEVLHWGALNEPCLSGTLKTNPITRLVQFVKHRLNFNSRVGSRKNISFHYDLGNDFYRLWLDETMTYSSAIFSEFDEPLHLAQQHKYQRLIDALDTRPGDSLLEVGCGWGGLAEQAVDQALQVTGLTLSQEQLKFARNRIALQGKQDNARFHLQDYRDADGQYDHIVSIEMFEAVGESYWKTYFETIYNRLKSGGRAAIQVITIDEAAFDNYRETPDFIQLYIFPGGMLPTVSGFEAMAQQSGFEVVQRDLFGDHYAETLRRWDQKFVAESDQVRAQGFSTEFMRMWRYYLAYCEAGFVTGRTNLMQIVLKKPE